MIDDGARARFMGLGATSLDVEVFAYMQAPDYIAFLGEQEAMLIAIMRVFEAEGVDFAFPSQTVYLGRDRRSGPVEEVRARAA